MSNKLIIWIIVAVVAVGLGWFLLMKKTSPAPQPDIPSPGAAEQQAPSAPKLVTVALSTQNNSGESGTATLTENDGKTVVAVSLTGAPSGVTQPAHIHTGTCAAIGGVAYPLTSPVNGKSETTLSVTINELLKRLPLAINVHKSGTEANIYVSCGDITAQNDTIPGTNQPAAMPSPASRLQY